MVVLARLNGTGETTLGLTCYLYLLDRFGVTQIFPTADGVAMTKSDDCAESIIEMLVRRVSILKEDKL